MKKKSKGERKGWLKASDAKPPLVLKGKMAKKFQEQHDKRMNKKDMEAE